MKKNNLGKTEILVSEICLGTMTWGQQNNEKEAHDQLSYASERGINFIDTAEMYAVPPKKETYGLTEKYIGTWLKNQDRSKIILATKIAGRTSNVPSGPPGLDWIRQGPRLNEEHIFQAIENSLSRLNTEYIDLYQIHWPERNVNSFGQLGYSHKENEREWNNFHDTLENLKKFVDEGKIRYIGLSNETPWGTSKFLQISEKKNLPRMMSIQNPYNLLNRTYEVGLAEISIRDQIGLLAYSPLASGYLSGKYRNNQLPKNSRIERDGDFWTRYDKPNTSKAVDSYFEISERYNLNFAQMSLKFCEIQKFVTSVIIGATTMEQLKTNIESINVKLSDEIKKEINNVQKVYPNPCP